MSDYSRRQFLQFMGRSAAVTGTLPWLVNCASKPATPPPPPPLPFAPLGPSGDDTLKLASGFEYDILLRWRQKLNLKGDLFGFNNDYLAFLPLDPSDSLDGLMWVNHEYHDPYFNSGWRPGQKRTRQQFHRERKEVGGSVAHMRKREGRWQLVENSKYNRRLDAYTPIPLIADRPILGRRTAIGTLANCAGGVTPWGTVLTCEENYDNFVGEAVYEGDRRTIRAGEEYLMWDGLRLPPEHYGWVVEVDLRTGRAKKLCNLGRFAHECATCVPVAGGRVVVYSGDDHDNEHLYKFISRKPGSLEEGDLYVADLRNGRWLPLNRREDPRLKEAFTDHTELMIRTREAAKIVGATPLDRPEDVEVDPITGHVFVSLTNNKKAKNYYGSILKIVEKHPLSLEFEASTFLAGGDAGGFACPDNLAFDRKGNLWMCTDISGSGLKDEKYQAFGNNGLFFIPLSGPHAGRALQVASAPNGAEFTGPCFAPDGNTLFLSVQHPGERGYEREHTLSHWPDGGDAVPAPCVVGIRGPTLDRLLA